MLTHFASHIRAHLQFTPPDADQVPRRRFDLDWLRVILFALLIIHHVGMFYVANWPWHAKSQFRFEWLESVLLVVEPWRMPAIWLISGVAIRFILAKVSLRRYISMRTLRLLLPLLFGVLVIVPPQLYVEMTSKGEIDMTYWQFMQAFWQSNHPIFENYQYGIWPHIDVNHLWYLRSLWYYSMALVLLLPLLNSSLINRFTHWFSRQPGWLMLLLVITPVLILQTAWQWSNVRYPIGFTFLLYGYLLGWQPVIWQRLQDNRKKLSLAMAGLLPLLLTGYNFIWIDVINGAEVAPGISVLMMMVYSSIRVVGLLVILAWGYHWLNRPSRALRYCNEAVYPFYILHQSVILVVGLWLTQMPVGPVLQPLLLISLTFTLCLIGFELIKRIELIRPCFGLKMLGTYSKPLTKFGYIAAALLISPLLWQLL